MSMVDFLDTNGFFLLVVLYEFFHLGVSQDNGNFAVVAKINTVFKFYKFADM